MVSVIASLAGARPRGASLCRAGGAREGTARGGPRLSGCSYRSAACRRDMLSYTERDALAGGSGGARSVVPPGNALAGGSGGVVPPGNALAGGSGGVVPPGKHCGGFGSMQWQPGVHAEPVGAGRAGGELPAQHGDPCAHPGQAMSVARGAAIALPFGIIGICGIRVLTVACAGAVVCDLDGNPGIAVADPDGRCRAGTGVLDRIGQ